MEEQRESNTTLLLFAASIATCVIAVVLLLFVLSSGLNDAGPGRASDIIGGDSSPTGDGGDAKPAVLSFVGPLPRSLDSAYFRGALDAKDADISFEPGGEGESVVHRFFVPVVPLHAALDSVTKAQLTELLGGRLSFADVGGIGGVPEFLAAEARSDIPAIRSFAEGSPRPVAGDSYDALRAAMREPGADIIAFVPIDELGPELVPLAVDGADLARGVGDPAQWPFVERATITGLTKQGKAAVPDLLAQLRTEPPQVTRVVATGDILQSRCSLAAIEATGDYGAALRGPVGEYLAAADLTLGSLDGSIQDIGEPYRCVAMEWPNLTSPPEVMEALTLAGFDALTVATNHIFDCGQAYCGNRAFLRTLELLTEAGIKYVGGGQNLDEALAPAIFERNGITFGVLGFDDVAAYDLEATESEPGTAPLDDSYAEELAAGEPSFFRPAHELSLTRFVDRIQRLKQQVDVVIVLVQSGTEDTHTPSDRSLKALRAAADAGADLVVGNQAHWVQAAEVRDGVFIAYALGNFIFDQVHTPEHTQGYLLEASFVGKKLAAVKLVPYQIEEKYKPMFVTGGLRAKILNDVWQASAELPAPDDTPQ